MARFTPVEDEKKRRGILSDGANAFTGSAIERFIDNFVGVTDQFGTQQVKSLLGPLNLARQTLGNDPIQIDSVLPFKPSGREVLAGADTLPSILSGNIPETFNAALDNRNRIAEENPTAELFGEVAGDALTLLAGRGPAIKLPAARTAKTTTDIIAPAIKPAIEKVFRSGTADKLSKLAGRSLEGGLEAAVLSTVQGGDPIENAALTAGTQAAGMAGLSLFGHIPGIKDVLKGEFVKGGGKLAATALAVGGLLQTLKTSTPGGEDSVIASIEAGFEKVPLALALGTLFGLTGAGRVKGGKLPFVNAEFPGLVMDAFSTIPRAGVINAIQEINKDETGNGEKVINQVLQNPGRFKPVHLEEINEALESEKYMETVNRLMQDDEFKRAIGSRFTPVEE